MSCGRFLSRTTRSSKVKSPCWTALPNLFRAKISPVSWSIAIRLRRGVDLTSLSVGALLIGTETFGQQSRKARQIEQIEGVVLARKHRDRRPFERVNMLPRLFQGHGF